MTDLDISRENFASESFDTKTYLNTLFNSKSNVNESDILSFKLQVLQRELANEIELNSTNVLKASKTITNDLNILGGLHYNLLTKTETFNQQMKNEKNNNTVSFEPQRALKMINANDNITKAIGLLDRNSVNSL